MDQSWLTISTQFEPFPVECLPGAVAIRSTRCGSSRSCRTSRGNDHEAAGRVDAEAARLLLGRRTTQVVGLAVGRIGAERGDRARGPFRRIDEASLGATWMSEAQTSFDTSRSGCGRGIPGRSVLPGGSALTLEISLRSPVFVPRVVTVAVSSFRRYTKRLSGDITDAAVPCRLSSARRAACSPRGAALLVERLEHLIRAEMRHEHVTVGAVADDGVRVARGRYHLVGIAHRAVRLLRFTLTR